MSAPPTELPPALQSISDAIAGRASQLDLSGERLPEAPRKYDLNPRLTRYHELRAERGARVPLLAIGGPIFVRIAERVTAGQQVEVYATPFVRTANGTGIMVTCIVGDRADAGAGRRRSSQHWLIGRPPRGQQDARRLQLFVLDDTGSALEHIPANWSLIVALADAQGIVCWRVPKGQKVLIAPSRRGFRRFMLDTGARVRDQEGWHLLKPVVPAD